MRTCERGASRNGSVMIRGYCVAMWSGPGPVSDHAAWPAANCSTSPGPGSWRGRAVRLRLRRAARGGPDGADGPPLAAGGGGGQPLTAATPAGTTPAAFDHPPPGAPPDPPPETA